MKTIPISGVIGWDVSPADVRSALKEAKGDDITLEISSPGGLVFDGLEIFNMIKNYPGEVTTKLTGLAASMASYIALAGKKVIAEANAVYMIHNAQGCACGDQNDLRKTADILASLSAVFAQAYAAKTGKTVAEITAMMDESTYLFGAEIKNAGFVDEIIGEPTTDKATACALALAQVSACDETVKKIADDESTSKIAAMIGELTPTNKTGVAGEMAAAKPATAEIEGGQKMTIDEFKAANPGALDAFAKENFEAGVKAERTRYEGINAFRGKNDKGDAAVAEAIAKGTPVAEAMPIVTAAVLEGMKANPAGDNAPDVHAQVPGNGSGATSAEEAEILAKAGLPADYLKGVK